MTRWWHSLVLLVFCGILYADEVVDTSSRPVWAVVRIPSHGISGTVIRTEQGKSWILSCAHGFEGDARSRAIKLNIPSPNPDNGRVVGVKLIRVDYALDLSLIELNDGPLVYVAPVKSGASVSKTLLSVGFDEMKNPPQQKPATIIGRDSRGCTLTREIPWHGRSGGALLDMEDGTVIGTVIGYRQDLRGAYMHGIYTSLDQIQRFLTDGQNTHPEPPSRYRWQPISEGPAATPQPWQPLQSTEPQQLYRWPTQPPQTPNPIRWQPLTPGTPDCPG